MGQWIRWHHRRPHAILHSGPFQGSIDSSKIWLYPRNDGHEKMRFLRHPPWPPASLFLSIAESRPTETPTTGDVISRFHLPTRAHPRRAHGGHPRRARLPRLPATVSKNGPSQPRERTSQQHRPDCMCARCGPRNHDQRRTAAFNRTLLTNEYRRVRKRIRIRMFYSKFEFSNFI